MNADIHNIPVVTEMDAGGLVARGRSEDAGAGDRARLLMAAVLRHPKLTLIFAVAGLLIGALGGYVLAPPAEYRSAGQIRIKPYLPRILYQGDQNSVMPMFDSFADSQVDLITSRQVLDTAMQSATWKDTRIAAVPQSKISVASRLTADHPRGGEFIEVAFTDTDPHVAMAVVRNVIDAYMKLYGASESEANAQRTQILEERCATLNAELKTTNEKIMAIADEFGSTALGRMYDFELDELNKLESELHRVQVALAGIESGDSAPGAAPSAAAAAAPEPIAVEVIARQDQHMLDLLQQREQRVQELDRLKLRYGPNHKNVEEVVVALQALDRDIQRYAVEYEEAKADGSIQQAPGAPYGKADLGQLRQREHNLQALVDGARSRMLDLGRKRLQIESLQRDVEEKQTRLSEAKTRIEQLSVESSMGGRISVLSYGDEPLAPFKSRRTKLAGVMGILGAIFGMSIVVARGLTDTRCHTIDDAHSTLRARTNVLGVLPDLPEDLSDPKQAAIAAHYVHHIRAMLQISRGHSQAAALAVTSAMPGSGKTSLTVALGLSFAASGARTLLIDCDMVGGGLTAKMGVRVPAKLGQILRQSGLVTREQVRTALDAARLSGRRLGQQLVALGYITEDDVEAALARAQAVKIGLLDVLGGEDLCECVATTQIKNLFVLPLGTILPEDAARLSPEAVHAVLEEAKRHFDTVLIDTGPIPGSIEAAMAAAEADRVILVISRGESRALAEQAISHLVSLGADIAGAVFNRAEAGDILASQFSSSVSARSVVHSLQQANNSTSLRLGPIAMAVAPGARSDEEVSLP